MGSIKDKANKEQTHTLTEEEFNYVMNINVAKQNIAEEYTRVISAFLKYIACSRLGYDPTADIQFELDFTDEGHNIKITPLS